MNMQQGCEGYTGTQRGENVAERDLQNLLGGAINKKQK